MCFPLRKCRPWLPFRPTSHRGRLLFQGLPDSPAQLLRIGSSLTATPISKATTRGRGSQTFSCRNVQCPMPFVPSPRSWLRQDYPPTGVWTARGVGAHRASTPMTPERAKAVPCRHGAESQLQTKMPSVKPGIFMRVEYGIRTHDNRNHNPGLYR